MLLIFYQKQCYGISFKQTELGFSRLGCHFLIIHPINSKMKFSHWSIIEKNDYYYICNHLENLIPTTHDLFPDQGKPILLDIGLKDNMFFGYCLKFLEKIINLL